MKEQTGCDAVMIGRAAIGNPWIFALRDKENLPQQDILGGVRLHAREMVGYYGEKQGLVLFRKHLKQYLSGLSGTETVLAQLIHVTKLAEFDKLLDLLEEPLPLL